MRIKMHYWYRIEKFIRRTNSFQIVLVSITVHCLISIFMIYFHLSLFLDDAKNSGPHRIESREGGIWYPGLQQLNLISNYVIENDEITHTGWWQDHSKFEVNIVCFQQRGVACGKVFSTECKSDRVRALYQYIPIKKAVNLRSLDISVRANAHQLQDYVSDASFGLHLLVKLSNGHLENVRVEFPSNIEEWTKRTSKYTTGKDLHIVEIVVMLMCHGYSGTVYFTDVMVVPEKDSTTIKSSSDVVDYCAESVTFTTKPSNVHKIETVSVPKEKPSGSLTLVTQVSMDRISVLEKTLQTWTGPVSLVVFIPLKNLSAGLLDWQKLYLNKKLKNLRLSQSSSVILLLSPEQDNEFPINKMRNLGINQVKTKYFFVIDADFQPSPDLQKRLNNVLTKQNYKGKVAFVLPAFEYVETPKKDDGIPKTKEEFLQLVLREDPLIQPFRWTESEESHKMTNYWKWYSSNHVYKVFGFMDKYEPYVILEKSAEVPLFDERFTGYGMNKVSHTTELFAARYTFLVLPDAWAVHLPHKSSAYSQDFLQNPNSKLKNRLRRFQFIHQVINKYAVKQPGCPDGARKKRQNVQGRHFL